MQPGQKHASSVICELSGQLRARGEPGPARESMRKFSLAWIWYRQHFGVDASIGKSSRPKHRCRRCCGRFVAGRKSADACNESAAELVPEACTDEDRQGRVQCSFCRELEHEEPSFCRKLAHEEPMGEKSVDFSAMACRKISFLPFFSKGPLSDGCAICFVARGSSKAAKSRQFTRTSGFQYCSTFRSIFLAFHLGL